MFRSWDGGTVKFMARQFVLRQFVLRQFVLRKLVLEELVLRKLVLRKLDSAIAVGSDKSRFDDCQIQLGSSHPNIPRAF